MKNISLLSAESGLVLNNIEFDHTSKDAVSDLFLHCSGLSVLLAINTINLD